ncbi:MAG: HPr family phosphocarrier protein [Microbacteriaceae bacterium]|jgi:phosphocarrier protein HPr|nr:HPr family phosphocarrier protein [Microbacteriaceae bacterium]
MAERNATIASRVGLHARPAGLFIEAVNKQSVTVTISKDGSAPMNAASILSIMSLGAAHGEIVTLHADGEGAEQALEELVALLQTDLDAE